jgi:hypothetical protein
MQEFRDAARKEASHLSGQKQLDFIEMMGALTCVLDGIRHTIGDLQVRMGRLGDELTGMASQEIAAEIGPIIEALRSLDARVSALESDAGDAAKEAGK